MKTISNSSFDELFKISIYRDITEQLQERHMITDSEYQKICQRIDAMEEELLKPDNLQDNCPREKTAQ